MKTSRQQRKRRRRPRRTVAWGLSALTLLALLAPAAAPAKKKRPTALYWGAQIGTQITGVQAPYDMTAVEKFEHVTGKGLSLLSVTAPFAECEGLPQCLPYEFPSLALENTRRYGAIPMLNWASTSDPPGLRDPGYQFADINSGSLDFYIREFAELARSWGHPFFLRFNWEMNGFWFPWSEGVNGNRRGEFVAAWRRVHDIFEQVGATNATWVWCPNVSIYGDLVPLKRLYPGGRYVDWTCLDGFNWGKRRGSPGWLSFGEIYRRSYHEIVREIAPRKPMIIGEVASSDRGGSKAAWIRNMLHVVRTRYRKIRGFLWHDINDRGTHWPIENSPGKVKRAFRRGIAHPAFQPNRFGEIATSPIPPPARLPRASGTQPSF